MNPFDFNEEIATQKRPRRLLQVLYSFRIGGSEIVGVELARQLAESGVEVMCAALDGTSGPLREQCRALNLPVVDLGIATANVLGRNGASLALTRRLKQLDLDCIHLHHFVSLNKLGIAARIAGIKRIVVTEHSEATLRQSRAGRLRLRLNWRLADAITVVHAGIKDYLVQEIGVNDARISVVPIGVDLDRWHRNDRLQCRTALGVDAEFVFMYVGRLAEEKNVSGLIAAFLKALPLAPRTTSLIIVGDGMDLPACRALVAQHDASHAIRFVGEQSDTRRYLAAADALVLNSRSEGTPRALLEAMAMGVPGIGPAVGGIAALLAARGWLTRADDPQSLADAILDAVSDPAKVELFGARAKSHIEACYDARDALARFQEVLLSNRTTRHCSENRG